MFLLSNDFYNKFTYLLRKINSCLIVYCYDKTRQSDIRPRCMWIIEEGDGGNK